MTETTTTPLHFADAVPREKNMCGHFAGMAMAHLHAFDRAILAGSTRGDRRQASDAHLHPANAAFAAAAAIKGWGPRKINEALAFPEGIREWCCQWLTDAGMAPEDIGRLTWTVAR
ncbi:hypothetical protein [Kineosporia sp. NBRC 101731]|uniref:hypothetical protein n=1 Tax=Kineosporia sp. NBRC 101731 TaxID=3032199 RepID=UPI0024A4A813|nr:hypothetical protein [Kineosporia sp. NBRC 101731]GLY32046.1 hypothetical protein Kisp02_54110 [Kineosporia sp. NBRC 101731]